MRAYWLQRLFPGFQFLRHAARAFLPTVPAAAIVLLARAVEPPGRTLGVALAELAGYVVAAIAATTYLESGLLREAAGEVRERPLAAA
jgi:hypothetical protein